MKYQLYAQYYALVEMGYRVDELQLHSLQDNRTYSIPLPDHETECKFEQLLEAIRSYDIDKLDKVHPSPTKCFNCIYNNLCDLSEAPSTD